MQIKKFAHQSYLFPLTMSFKSHYKGVTTLGDPKSNCRVDLVLNTITGNYAVVKSLSLRKPEWARLANRELLLSELPNCSQSASVIRYHAIEEHDTGGHPMRIFLMDYFPNKCLQRGLHPHLVRTNSSTIFRTGNPVATCDVWKYFCQLVNCISWLHYDLGIAHRDLKSENILLDDDFNLVVMDFDRCNKISDNVFRSTGVGSILYVPLEVTASHNVAYDKSIDFFTLGILLYEICTGRWPFLPERGNVQALSSREQLRAAIEEKMQLGEVDYSQVDDVFVPIIKGLMDNNPVVRTQTYHQLLTDPDMAAKLDHYALKRPRFCKIKPLSDCDYLLVTDKCRDEVPLSMIEQHGDLAQVLLVNTESEAVTLSTAYSFISHLKTFVLAQTNVQNVEFDMKYPQLSSQLTDLWHNIHK
ncbi:hypothetical protein P9112_004450 [Eukaryota sp. TZLM1-RC]